MVGNVMLLVMSVYVVVELVSMGCYVCVLFLGDSPSVLLCYRDGGQINVSVMHRILFMFCATITQDLT